MGLLKSIFNLLDATADNVGDALQEIDEGIEKDINKLSKKIDQKAQEMREDRQKYLESKK